MSMAEWPSEGYQVKVYFICFFLCMPVRSVGRLYNYTFKIFFFFFNQLKEESF